MVWGVEDTQQPPSRERTKFFQNRSEICIMMICIELARELGCGERIEVGYTELWIETLASTWIA